MSLIETLQIRSTQREQFLDITRQVQQVLDRHSVRTGLCHVFSTHTTAGLTINENADPDVPADMLKWLRETIPQDGGFRHGEGNSDAHLKTSLFGVSHVIAVHDGRLALGRWQGVFLCEFDGPRTRTVQVTVI